MKFSIKYISISLLIVSGLLGSCEKEVSVKQPSLDTKLVLGSFSLINDSLRLSLNTTRPLDRSYAVLDSVSTRAMLYENGLPIDNLNRLAHPFPYNDYISNYKMQAGKKYKIVVTSNQLGTASAEVVAPSEVLIDRVDVVENARIDPDGTQQSSVTITFKDPPSSGDYYILAIDRQGESNIYGYTCVYTTDISVEMLSNEEIDVNTCISSNGIFMRDAFFNGTTKTLKLFVRAEALLPDYSSGDTVYAYVSLSHVPEALFRYKKSLANANDNNDNPFAEPANVYTNVVNGYGIFSIESRDIRTIR
jgi:hypothetical protein